jgi:NADP-reducing hydrogenase subunit HndB
MTKVKTPADLKKLRENLKEQIRNRESGKHSESTIQVKVAMATCGIASGAKEVMTFFKEELERGIEAVVTPTGCMGYCYAEPTVEITIPGERPLVFGYVNTRKADEIIEKYIKNGELVDGIIPDIYQSIIETPKES